MSLYIDSTDDKLQHNWSSEYRVMCLNGLDGHRLWSLLIYHYFCCIGNLYSEFKSRSSGLRLRAVLL